MDATRLKRLTAAIPVLMSLAALLVVIVHAAVFGAVREPDEGTAAHLWQLLMAGQVPVIAFFAVKWLPARPRQAVIVLAIQLAAAFAAMLPVWWFQF